MKASGSMDEEMVKGSKSGQMVRVTMASGSEVESMEKERTHTQMATLTLAIGLKIRNMGTDVSNMLAELSTQVTG